MALLKGLPGTSCRRSNKDNLGQTRWHEVLQDHHVIWPSRYPVSRSVSEQLAEVALRLLPGVLELSPQGTTAGGRTAEAHSNLILQAMCSEPSHREKAARLSIMTGIEGTQAPTGRGP